MKALITQKRTLITALFSLASLYTQASWADEQPLLIANGQSQLNPPLLSGYVEGGVGHAALTAGYDDWNDQYLRGYAQLGANNGINWEISRQDHFGDQGTYFAAGYTRIFDEKWYASIGAGTSDGGFFLPSKRVDGFIYRKWLDRNQLVTSLGAGYYRAKDEHFDRSLTLGAAWYLEIPLILECGARFNQSNPGDVHAKRSFAAATWGTNKHQYLTLRYEKGQEAYQIIGPDSVISDFSSRETTATWRQWLSSNVGFNLRASRYTNPSYRRTGGEVGLFLDF